MSKRTKVILSLILLLCSVLLGLGLVECVYRYQLVDFYAPEFAYLNMAVKNKRVVKKALVFGDSFSAASNSYVNMLNDTFSDIGFINAAVPGTGIQEQLIIATRRIQQVNPSFVILQLYVGNDLLDIQKPVNLKTVSVSRNFFWFASRYAYSVRFVNYRLGQWMHTMGSDSSVQRNKNDELFNLSKFNQRERILLQADPYHFEQSILLTSSYDQRYNEFQQTLNRFTALCKQQQLPLLVLVIPASCQVNTYYHDHIQQAGGAFAQPYLVDTAYPFITALRNRTTDAIILNPLPAFKQHDRVGHRLYYENDLHLSDRGNALLAQFMVQAIQRFR